MIIKDDIIVQKGHIQRSVMTGKVSFVNGETVQTEDELKDLYRVRRENECFTVINRGKAWYNLLSAEQEKELAEWYYKWLNVTETMEIPTAPSWLNDKLGKSGEEFI